MRVYKRVHKKVHKRVYKNGSMGLRQRRRKLDDYGVENTSDSVMNRTYTGAADVAASIHGVGWLRVRLPKG